MMGAADSDPISVVEKAGIKAWVTLALLAVPAVLVMVNMSVLYLALPAIGSALRPSTPELLWIADGYGFAVAGLLLTAGILGDRYGHRRLVLIGATLFAGASLLGAFAPSPAVLIAARAAQGLGAAAIAPSSLAVVRRTFNDPAQRMLAITIWMLAFMTRGSGRTINRRHSAAAHVVGIGLPDSRPSDARPIGRWAVAHPQRSRHRRRSDRPAERCPHRGVPDSCGRGIEGPFNRKF